MADPRNSLVAAGMARRNIAKTAAEIDLETINAIRSASGTMTITEIARLVGVDRSTIYRMLDRAPNSERSS